MSSALLPVLCLLLAATPIFATTIYPCGENLQLLRHATSCSQFIICMHGQAVPQSCRPGFQFDQNALQCLPASVANCTVETDPCPPYDDPQNLIFHTEEDFCNRFSLCYRGEKVPMTCASGLYWDRNNHFCTLPADADCPVSINCPNTPGISYEPHPLRCESYFICINGNLIDVSSCTYPMIFDVHERNCNLPEIAQCVRDPCLQTTGHAQIPNPDDCSEVLVCQNGRLVNSLTCPEGQISNDQGQCVFGDPETCEIFGL